MAEIDINDVLYIYIAALGGNYLDIQYKNTDTKILATVQMFVLYLNHYFFLLYMRNNLNVL